MKSFRSEIENPLVAKDILELETKIRAFKEGTVDEEKFRSLRLARGVYGQRQPGVQMIRIKLPYGKVASKQLHRISDVSDEYSTGRLHITTRQDIQIHYVDLERTPELWAQLEKDQVTLREACGNAVRNVTASETAGIDPLEPFDVSPYAQGVFEYFLRNPVGQELGRKFKVSFSGTDQDTGLSYMHDLGFIAKIENGVHGFKVMLAGGLGSQPRHADALYSFLAADKIVPLMEAIIRVFDRYGERKSRAKARLKFLLKDLGLAAFKALVSQEQMAVPTKSYPFDVAGYPYAIPVNKQAEKSVTLDETAFAQWKKTNVIAQKQEGFVAIGIKVFLGDFYTKEARQLADLVQTYAAGEIRLTLRQNILIPFVHTQNIRSFYQALKALNLADPGYNKALDITACPGTDTCNLGIASSTGIAAELEAVIKQEYPSYINHTDVVIKISGCMNACGQHNMASIGFQGMSIRTKDKRVAPALQVLLGGANKGNGQGVFADKVAKLPSKKGPQALRLLLTDYEQNGAQQKFSDYYQQQGKNYFYELLKPLSDTSALTDADFIDWGSDQKYEKAIGIGECAGVVIDLVATLFFESDEKLSEATTAMEQEKWAAAIYYGYAAMVNGAKALLISKNIPTNTHAGIIRDFDTEFANHTQLSLSGRFKAAVLQIHQQQPTAAFAATYLATATEFVAQIKTLRNEELATV